MDDEYKGNDEYMGDGVYASHDGYHVWLAVNHHENRVVALDPDVMLSLAEYFTRVSGRPIHTEAKKKEDG